MELDVSNAIMAPATPFPFQAEVGLEPQEILGDTVTFDPVALSGEYYAADGTVRISGRLNTVAHGVCALCMQPASAAVTLSFDELFRRDANETEDECFRYEGKLLPLDHMTLTLVMLNLPMRFVCKDGCEGSEELRAWRKQNHERSCEDGSPTQRPFEALQSLLKKDEEV